MRCVKERTADFHSLIPACSNSVCMCGAVFSYLCVRQFSWIVVLRPKYLLAKLWPCYTAHGRRRCTRLLPSLHTIRLLWNALPRVYRIPHSPPPLHQLRPHPVNTHIYLVIKYFFFFLREHVLCKPIFYFYFFLFWQY